MLLGMFKIFYEYIRKKIKCINTLWFWKDIKIYVNFYTERKKYVVR